ncbi:Formyltransferase [Corynespora cassiicola Philippines]|uniref:methionyl-tRNA formyltransferase n=1 Tax=Corynespora cassiicola Philippines TaxID=1448308 RepID=A0A2T2NEW4_CORCC|nr:Formyltransferase [Corynespora cassiicola Philippines]
MLWRLRAPVRSLAIRSCRRYSSTWIADPLRILFCGSDEFSIASLRALTRAQGTKPNLIQSIDVVHRPGKPTGRGLKKIREVPIKHVAREELQLPTHEIDTFTGWTPPIPFDVIIAVSFGLFVPPRILNLAKYGGLNVHPSLLPDLYGPAPIHQTILKGRKTTGVTVQTLDPRTFDRGVILAQTPAPGLRVDETFTYARLAEELSTEGERLLVAVLESGKFVPPLKNVGWYAESGGPVGHAEKLTPEHRRLDFDSAEKVDYSMIMRAVGQSWGILPNGARLIISQLKDCMMQDNTNRKPGLFVDEEQLAIKTLDNQILHVEKCTYEGGKRDMGHAAAIRALGEAHMSEI